MKKMNSFRIDIIKKVIKEAENENDPVRKNNNVA